MKDNNRHLGIWLMRLCMLVGTLFGAPAWCQSNVELILDQSPSEAGQITPGVGVHHFVANTQIEVTAVPQEGFQFAYWLGDVSDPTTSTTQIYLNDSKAVVAIYEPVAPVPGEDDDILRIGGTTGGGGGGLSPSSSDFFSVSFSVAGGSVSGGQSVTYQVIASEPIPEPGTLCLLGLGGLALANRKIRIRPA